MFRSPSRRVEQPEATIDETMELPDLSGILVFASFAPDSLSSSTHRPKCVGLLMGPSHSTPRAKKIFAEGRRWRRNSPRGHYGCSGFFCHRHVSASTYLAGTMMEIFRKSLPNHVSGKKQPKRRLDLLWLRLFEVSRGALLQIVSDLFEGLGHRDGPFIIDIGLGDSSEIFARILPADFRRLEGGLQHGQDLHATRGSNSVVIFSPHDRSADRPLVGVVVYPDLRVFDKVSQTGPVAIQIVQHLPGPALRQRGLPILPCIGLAQI